MQDAQQNIMESVRNNLMNDYTEIMRQKDLYSELIKREISQPVTHIEKLCDLIGKSKIIIRSKVFSSEDMRLLQSVLCFFDAVKNNLSYDVALKYAKHKNLEAGNYAAEYPQFMNYVQNYEYFAAMNGFPYNQAYQANNVPNAVYPPNFLMQRDLPANGQNVVGHNNATFQPYPMGDASNYMPSYERNLKSVANNHQQPESASSDNSRTLPTQSRSVIDMRTIYISSPNYQSSDDEVHQLVPQNNKNKNKEKPPQLDFSCQTTPSLRPPPLPPKPIKKIVDHTKKIIETQTTPSLWLDPIVIKIPDPKAKNKDNNEPCTSKDVKKKNEHEKLTDKNKKHKDHKDVGAAKRQVNDANKVSSSTHKDPPKKPKLCGDPKKYRKENPEILKILKKYEANIEEINKQRKMNKP